MKQQNQPEQLKSDIHFGAKVYISYQDKNSKFYMYSNGITYRKVLAVSQSEFSFDLNQCLFLIVPVMKFKSEQILEAILTDRYTDDNKDYEQKKTKSFIDQFEFELQQNIKLKDQQLNYPIKYNQNFMLQHVYSSKFLCVFHDTDNNQYSLQLMQMPTKTCVFNISACFNYQKDINIFIPFNSAAFLTSRNQNGFKVNQIKLNFARNSIFDSWYFSEESSSKICFQLYQTGNQIQYKNICFGDSVWIFHLQSGSFVKVIDEARKPQSIIVNKIKYSLGYTIQEVQSKRRQQKLQKTQVVVQKELNQMSAEKFGLWQILPVIAKEGHTQANQKGKFIGGRVKFGQQIRFFNIKYKAFLSVRRIKKSRNKFQYQYAMQQNQELNTIFEIRSLSSNSAYVTTEDLFLVKNISSNTYLTLSVPFAVNQTQALLSPSSDHKKQDNFKFTKIDFLQLWQNNTLLSIMPFIDQGIRALKQINSNLQINSRDKVMLKILHQNLIQLLSFSFDLTEGFQASENKVGKLTYNHFFVQKLFKQQGVINKIIKILEIINPTFLHEVIEKSQGQKNQISVKLEGIINITKKYEVQTKKIGYDEMKKIQMESLKNIINTSLKILRNFCKSNIQNSLLLFEHFQTLAKYLSFGIYTQNLFIECFSIPIILQKIGSKQIKIIINQYTKICKITNLKSQKIFQLLDKLIHSSGSKSISKNQLEVYTQFFYKQNPLLINLQQIDGKYFIDSIQLNQFCQQFPDIANILGYQLKFFSSLAADRNYVCSKSIKDKFSLTAILQYLTSNSLKNQKIKQSFIWIIIHCYLNQRPRFNRTSQRMFKSFQQQNQQNKHRYSKQNYEMQLQVMKESGFSNSIIQDIFSCVKSIDSMNQQILSKLKNYVVNKITIILNQQQDSHKFLTEKMQAYLSCLKYMIQFSLFEEQQAQLQKIIIQLTKKMQKTLTVHNNNHDKIQSNNFNEVLLQMMQKDIFKKFNNSVKNDGIEDQVKADNICFIYVNHTFYQNILLQDKQFQNRRIMNQVIKVVIQLLSLFKNIKQEAKLKNCVNQLINHKNQWIFTQDKSALIKQVVLDKFYQFNPDKTNLFSLLALIFFNSNTFQINYISLNCLLSEIFCERLSMEKLSNIQFIVDEKEAQQFEQIQSLCKSIRLLVETSEVWFNQYNIVKSKFSRYDSVILLFIGKVKSLLKIMMPQFDQQIPDPLYCLKHTRSILPQKQLTISNMRIHQQIIYLITQYRQLLLKIKSQQIKVYNSLLGNLFKCCFLFLYTFIHDCPENKRKIRELVRDFYLRDYFRDVDQVDFGETLFVMEFLKDNYEEGLEFYGRNPEAFQKCHKYTTIHSKLLLTTLTYYNEPIIANLKKFYILIFDFSSFRTFLWLKPNTNEFNLNLKLYDTENNKQPYLYHINAIQAILLLTKYVQQSRNTIKQHIKKCLPQQYLYSLLKQDDFYSNQSSNDIMLKIMIQFKQKIMKLIEFVYLNQLKDNDLVLGELKRQHKILLTLKKQAKARQQNQDFKKVIIIRNLKQSGKENKKIKQVYQNHLLLNKKQNILQTFLESINHFCLNYRKFHLKSTDKLTQSLVAACQNIHQQIASLYDLLHKSKGKILEQQQNQVIRYPMPYEWIFSISSANRTEQSITEKRFFHSILLQSIFNKQIYNKFKQIQIKSIQIFVQTLHQIHLKPILFLQKLAQFMQDLFQTLQNNPKQQIYNHLYMLINFLSMMITSSSKQNINEVRNIIGKSQFIFPILNYFQKCYLNSQNKKLFLTCIEFFNELIGEEGQRSIQKIFNIYFNNKSDSIEFFMKIKQLFDAINFQDKINYKCKKIYNSIQQLLKDCKSQKQPQFVILNFLIRLCQGNYRENQIYLSSLRNISNFNIMSGIWQILKNQTKKYNKNLINVQNYYLITQCFTTIRQLVEGPCVQNQNQFLKRDFFLTVLQYFQFQSSQMDQILQKSVLQKIYEIQKISSSFTNKIKIYLNRDKITQNWMVFQVKYRCISLICSLLSQNVNQQSKSQLYTIGIAIIMKQLDRVYDRYVQLQLSYTYQNLQFKDEAQVILPLGFKLYELLQYYPPEKIPQNSPGLDFFRQNSRVVQVVHQKLCIVTFPRIPNQISQAFKNKFIQQVDRSSINSKLKALQDSEVQNKQSDFPYGYFLLFMSILVNFLDIAIYDKQSEARVKLFNFYQNLRLYQVHPTIQVVIVSCLLISSFFSMIFFILEVRGATYFKQQIVLIATDSETKLHLRILNLIKFLWKNLTYFHYFITMVLCTLAIFNPMFDAILLLVQLYRRSETFSAIVDAISSTLDQLMIVLLLTLVCTYVLTVFIYFYRASQDYPQQCMDIYHCFVFSLDLAFRADAGIVGFTDDTNTILQVFQTQPLFDVLVNFIYLFIIKIIIDQILGAIIVDKFASLRQNKQKLEEDENSVCFICGLNRSQLDRQQDGFQTHKQLYHNIWNYFQFLIYLRKSKVSNLAGIEFYVYEQQKNGKLNWFPINRSYHLQQKNKQNNQKLEQQNSIYNALKILGQQVEELKEQVDQTWSVMNIKMLKQTNQKLNQ